MHVALVRAVKPPRGTSETRPGVVTFCFPPCQDSVPIGSWLQMSLKLKGRAPASEAGGCRFDSCQGLVKANSECRLCRQGRRLNPKRVGLCDGCWEVTAAEGTRAQFGAPTTTSTRNRFLARIKHFNKLRAKGYGIQQIADEWGCTKHAVRVVARRARQQGLPVEPKYIAPKPPKPPKEPSGLLRGRPMVPHGGGSVGRFNCPCELCVKRKREYQREYNKKWMKDWRAKKRVAQDAG